MNREVRKLVSSISGIPGVEVTEAGSGHLLVTKDGAFVVSLSSTPSDVRWRENALSRLRRAGITPGVRQKKGRPTRPVIRSMDLRAALMPIRESRQVAPFARFTQQLGEIRGMRVYKNVDSAESSIGEFIRSGGNLSPWACDLIMASLMEWRRREPEPEAAVALVPPIEQPSAGVKLVVDLSQLAAKLAEFGIELEVQ